MIPDVFKDIQGNEEAKHFLTSMVTKNRIANSLLFVGPDNADKGLFAETFAKLILKENKIEYHPDLHILKPEGKIGMHSIESMRRFTEEVYLPPYKATKKVFIIHNAERMLTYSANALLKTFEEPALSSIIILVSHAPEKMLPTVISRCFTVRFKAVNVQKTIVDSPLRKQVLDYLSQGKFSTYSELIAAAKSLSEQIEAEVKELEKEARAQLLEAYSSDITSVQQQALDKEMDGFTAMETHHRAMELFNWILSWFRDMHLLYVRGNQAYLHHPDYLEQCEQALQKAQLLPLEKVQQAIDHSTLSLERSTPFASCLENLFIQLFNI